MLPALAPLLIGPVAELLNTVLKRVLPAEKMTEAERKQVEGELAIELLKADWSRLEAEFKDRADARALAAADASRGNAATMILSAMVRPVWGFSALIVVAYPYLAGALDLPAVTIDDATKDIVQTVIMFYFGGRTAEKIASVVRASK
jgi:hypothetical protein